MKLVIGVLAVWLTLAVSVASAATTEPRGIYTVKVPGKPINGIQSRTYLGIQLLPSKLFQGSVASVSGSSLTLENHSSPSSLNDPERKCYVHVLSGNGSGYIADIEEFRYDDILCTSDLTPWMTDGTSCLIRPHSRLDDIFGADNRFGLGSGPNAAQADNVVTWDPVTQQEKVYYFHDTRVRWEEKGVEDDASDATLRFPYGIFIVRRTAGTLRLSLSGDVGSHSVLLPVRPGANVFSLPVNLSASLDELISTDGSYSVSKGSNAWRSDLLTFREPFSGSRRGPFYYFSSPLSEGWREIGVNGSNAPLEPLDLLSTLIVHHGGPPGHVLARGSLEPGNLPSLPPDPEPGEPPLIGELPFPSNPPPQLLIMVETSTDLQTWSEHATPTIDGGKAIFELPAGQTRAFYRLNVTLN